MADVKKYVVIGSSAAGTNGVRELRKRDADAEITLISKDTDIYSRCILHAYLGGHRTKERLRFVEPDFEERYRVNWMKGEEAVGLDRAGHKVLLAGGKEVPRSDALAISDWICSGLKKYFSGAEGSKTCDNVCSTTTLGCSEEFCIQYSP